MAKQPQGTTQFYLDPSFIGFLKRNERLAEKKERKLRLLNQIIDARVKATCPFCPDLDPTAGGLYPAESLTDFDPRRYKLWEVYLYHQGVCKKRDLFQAQNDRIAEVLAEEVKECTFRPLGLGGAGGKKDDAKSQIAHKYWIRRYHEERREWWNARKNTKNGRLTPSFEPRPSVNVTPGTSRAACADVYDSCLCINAPPITREQLAANRTRFLEIPAFRQAISGEEYVVWEPTMMSSKLYLKMRREMLDARRREFDNISTAVLDNIDYDMRDDEGRGGVDKAESVYAIGMDEKRIGSGGKKGGGKRGKKGASGQGGGGGGQGDEDWYAGGGQTELHPDLVKSGLQMDIFNEGKFGQERIGNRRTTGAETKSKLDTGLSEAQREQLNYVKYQQRIEEELHIQKTIGENNARVADGRRKVGFSKDANRVGYLEPQGTSGAAGPAAQRRLDEKQKRGSHGNVSVDVDGGDAADLDGGGNGVRVFKYPKAKPQPDGVKSTFGVAKTGRGGNPKPQGTKLASEMGTAARGGPAGVGKRSQGGLDGGGDGVGESAVDEVRGASVVDTAVDDGTTSGVSQPQTADDSVAGAGDVATASQRSSKAGDVATASQKSSKSDAAASEQQTAGEEEELAGGEGEHAAAPRRSSRRRSRTDSGLVRDPVTGEALPFVPSKRGSVGSRALGSMALSGNQIGSTGLGDNSAVRSHSNKSTSSARFNTSSAEFHKRQARLQHGLEKKLDERERQDQMQALQRVHAQEAQREMARRSRMESEALKNGPKGVAGLGVTKEDFAASMSRVAAAVESEMAAQEASNEGARSARSYVAEEARKRSRRESVRRMQELKAQAGIEAEFLGSLSGGAAALHANETCADARKQDDSPDDVFGDDSF